MVGKTGFEPATTRSQTECSTKLSHFPINGVPKRSRTPNLLIRSQTLYPVELWGQPVQNIYKLRLAFKNGGFSWNRTNDTKIFSLVLCQLSYEATMAVPTGIEPAIPRVTGECDNRYTTEPLVAGEGFEPPTFGLWAQRATRLLYPAMLVFYFGGGKGIWTPAPLSRPPGFQDQSLQPDLGIPPTRWCLGPDLNRHGI